MSTKHTVAISMVTTATYVVEAENFDEAIAKAEEMLMNDSQYDSVDNLEIMHEEIIKTEEISNG